MRGGLDEGGVARRASERSSGGGGGRGGRRPCLDLGLELSHLLWAGQRLQQGVLLLQLRVALDQLLDLLLQDLHLLAHGVHQVAFYQVLRGTQTHTSVQVEARKNRATRTYAAQN